MPYLARGARLGPPLLALLITGLSSSPLGAAAGRWSPIGPEGGTVLAVVFAPSDPRVVYAVPSGGGVFRSADGGVTWTAPAGMMAGRVVFSLAVDPRNPAIAYAGTYDGVWKTASGGAAWTVFPDHLAGITVLHLLVDPSRPRTLYAGTDKSVFRSDDGGRTWAPASQGLPAVRPNEGEGSVTALALDPGPPVRLFATVQRQNQLTEIFTSADRGVTWTKVNSPGAGINQVSGFVWDRTSHSLYMNAWPSGFAAEGPALWKTSDGGATWSRLILPVPLARNDVELAVDASGTLYAGSTGVWKSADGGVHWSEVGPIESGGGPRVFASVLSLAADSGRSGRVLAGTFDLGIFESTGGAWRTVNQGLTGTYALALEIVSAARSQVLYAAVFGGGVFQSRDGGAHWVPRNQGLEPEGAYAPYHLISSLALDPRRPDRLYAGLFRDVARSTDGGAHWSFSTISECATMRVLTVDPGSDTVYAAADGASDCALPCSLHVSRDAGRTWFCSSGVDRAITAFVDPVNTAVVYVASDGQRGLFKSTDRGASFVLAGFANQDVRALAISPAAHRVVYAGTAQGVFKSRDAGAHWAPIGLVSNPVSALAVDVNDARVVYAGVTGLGVFQSVDGGATWKPLNEGLPTAGFSGPLRLDSRTRTLYAGTYGSGFWSITLP